MTKNKYNNIKKKPIFYLIFLILFVQICITYLYTNSKIFSKRALIRNVTFVIFIYLAIITKKFVFILIPFFIEILLETLKWCFGLHIDKYIATKYQYNDYWREIVKDNPIFSNFSEGNYNEFLGFDTTDHSEQNLKKILKWSKKIYADSLNNNIKYITGPNDIKHIGSELKKKQIMRNLN